MIGRVQRLCGNHARATYDLVGAFINSRHDMLLGTYEWSRKKQEIIKTVVADKTGGTVTVVSGSTGVTGSSTSWATSDEGRYIEINSDGTLYLVNDVTLATALVLGDLKGNTVGYAGDSASALSYVMFTRWYSLGTGINSILSVKHKLPITEVSQEWLDEQDPTRQTTGDTPRHFARGPWDQSGTKDEVRIEFWPRPTSAIGVTVVVLKGHTDLLPSQHPIVPSAPLEWFAATDTCYNLFAQTKEEKWLKLADKYNGEAEKSLEREKTLDAKRFGLNQKIKDTGGLIGLEHTDFALTHDV